MIRRAVVFIGVLAVTACAITTPVPPGHSGPTAYLRDSNVYEDGSKTQLFVVVAIDGEAIKNSVGATAGASSGQGFRVTPTVVGRSIPVRPMKVTIRGTHATGAPIQAFFGMATGSYLSIEGVVEFQPEADGLYVVKGELRKEGSSVWIEDLKTNTVVTPKISKPAS
jgi:hypothetical protein